MQSAHFRVIADSNRKGNRNGRQAAELRKTRIALQVRPTIRDLRDSAQKWVIESRAYMNIYRQILSVVASALIGWAACPVTLGGSFSQSSNVATESLPHIVMTVTDKHENPLVPPAKESIQVRIDGQSAENEEIRSLKDTPLIFSVLVDVSGSTRHFANQEAGAAIALFRHLSSANNHGYLVLFNSGVLTTDRVVDAVGAEQLLTKFPAESRTGMTCLFDAINHVVVQQLDSATFRGNPRRTIFVLSDGGDNASHESLDATVKLAQREGVSIFSIALSRQILSAPTPEERQGWENLSTLSYDTGGLATFLDEPAGDPVRIAHLMDGQCLLSFKLPTAKSDKLYPLKIKSSDKEIVLLASSRYFMP